MQPTSTDILVATTPQDVLDFWFGTPDSPEYGQPRTAWFVKDIVFDEAIRRQFGRLHEEVAAGQHDDWANTPTGMLALLIVLDQFSRNLYRNDPRAFACDTTALAWATQLLARGWVTQYLPVQLVFCYLPFEHAEDLVVQQQSVKLFAKLRTDNAHFETFYDYAVRHHDVIARFGRFPHRNPVLGRASTSDELVFLSQPGSSF
ncbi:DUF924 family protein [Chitinivorax sp. B]|uniref:DUF924 family protein n=1 Tax=Chitinivorax sp. B TaxID=2502235 RepID=UPI002016B850|nr:DUF924 family protein [Chitinivorax sp. B]